MRILGGLLGLLAGVLLLPAGAADATVLRFEVRMTKGLLTTPRDGRVLVVLARRERPEPRFAIGQTGLRVPPVLGQDVQGFDLRKTVVLDASASIYPLPHLARLPRGEYVVQAIFDHNRDLRIADAPDNLVSIPTRVFLDPVRGGVVSLDLTRKLPADEPPPDRDQVKFLKFRSEKLSKFHGRPMYLRAGVILPSGHAQEPMRRYPLRVVIGGFGTRYTVVRDMMRDTDGFARVWNAPETPRMILLHLDGAGPFGDPYQVNSANNGPYGDAVTQELIPHIEKTYRGLGKGYARVLEGASTGGWVSLALQVFYPDFFNGAWSHCPDPVDFTAFEVINLYRDDNVYTNAGGFDRPSAREKNGDVRFTVRNEAAREITLGRGNRWTLSGKDWGSWNAVFGPRGPDGLPAPLWDASGAIDRKVVGHWQQYDLRLRLQKYAAVLGPKLRGKLHIWVGEADDYFLNNAVHKLEAFARKMRPALEAKITFGPGEGHDWRGLDEKQLMQEMAAAIERGRQAAGE